MEESSDVPGVIRPFCKAPKPPSDMISRNSQAHPGAINFFAAPCFKTPSLTPNPQIIYSPQCRSLVSGTKFPAAFIGRLKNVLSLQQRNHRTLWFGRDL